MEVDLRIEIGYDERSEEALRTALAAARVLRRDYGIYAYVVPSQLWVHDPLYPGAEVPRIYINHKLVMAGRVPGIEELVDHVIAYLWNSGSDAEVRGVAANPVPRVGDAAPVATA